VQIGAAESGGKTWRKKIGGTVVADHSTVMARCETSSCHRREWWLNRLGDEVTADRRIEYLGCCRPHKQKRRLPEGKRRFV
jgi:hypothetical protein